MIRLLHYLKTSIILLCVSVATLWGTLAIYYKLPAPEGVQTAASCAFAVLGCTAIVLQFGARRFFALKLFTLAFAGLLTWWMTIEPPADANWSPDVARQVTGQIDGDLLTLENVREFEWRTNDDFTEHWSTRTYDLNKLQSVDMFMSHWAGPQIAHFIVSFGFEGDEYLAWSIEVRRTVGGVYSPVANFFKGDSLIILAAVEQDVVGVRSNVRGEDVQLFRLRPSKETARALLTGYVRDANNLAEKPAWYNSLTTNCTTVVFKMTKALGLGVPFDWRLVLNGYLPDFAYERKSLNTEVSLAELRKRGQIASRAKEVGLGPEFSTAIRQGVPMPD
ncbi:MAG: DUF4105 domain-containing protein [Roseobacter sp.]